MAMIYNRSYEEVLQCNMLHFSLKQATMLCMLYQIVLQSSVLVYKCSTMIYIRCGRGLWGPTENAANNFQGASSTNKSRCELQWAPAVVISHNAAVHFKVK